MEASHTRDRVFTVTVDSEGTAVTFCDTLTLSTVDVADTELVAVTLSDVPTVSIVDVAVTEVTCDNAESDTDMLTLASNVSTLSATVLAEV